MSFIDVLYLRRPRIDYVSPPICDIIASSGSPVIVLEPFGGLEAISGLILSGTGRFRLSWDRYPGALCYSIYRAVDEEDPMGDYDLIAECIPDNFIDLTIHGPGCYRISAITANGESTLTSPTCGVGHDAPEVVTDPETLVTTTQATLNGEINPNNEDAEGWFEWGLTTSYGNSTVHQPVGSGGAPVAIDQLIPGLTSGTVYHYRAAGSNAFGTSYGEDEMFSTDSPPPGPNIDVVELNPVYDEGGDGVVVGTFH